MRKNRITLLGAGFLLTLLLLILHGAMSGGGREPLPQNRQVRVDIRSAKNIDFLLTIAGDRTLWILDPVLESAYVEAYRRDWQQYERRVVQTLQDEVGLGFATKTIEVYLSNSSGTAVHRPIIIPFGRLPEERDVFLPMLIHELIHRLFTDNPQVDVDAISGAMMPGRKDVGMRLHVIVFAFLKRLLRDVLGEPRLLELQQAKDREGKRDAYAIAWEEVDRRGSARIIRDFKAWMRQMRKSGRQ